MKSTKFTISNKEKFPKNFKIHFKTFQLSDNMNSPIVLTLSNRVKRLVVAKVNSSGNLEVKIF